MSIYNIISRGTILPFNAKARNIVKGAKIYEE